MHSFKVKIQGRVQGVGFRYYTEREAIRLGITGWVRNCVDGSVEAFVCGEEDSIQAMLAWLKHGPSPADVSAVYIEEMQTEETSIPTHFEIKG